MGFKRRNHRFVLLFARPFGRPPHWWPRTEDGKPAWVTVKRDGSGWSYAPNDRSERIREDHVRDFAFDLEQIMDKRFSFRTEPA